MEEKILEVRNINKTFSGAKAVDNVSFELYRGEILGLLGPNGAGKTTVIRMLMRIFKPDAGEINYNQELISNNKNIGYLPEERGIYDETRVLDTILYFADLKGFSGKKAKNKVWEWLAILELGDFADKKIEDLSKGMQQKVQFIISAIHKPNLLVLDEVFSGLDPVNQDLFKKIILKLVEEGTSILLSSHRMNMVEELCDRIFMINRGKRVLYGSLNKIKDEFGKRQVKMVARGALDFLQKSSEVMNLKVENDVVSFNLALKHEPKKFISRLPEDLEVEEISILRPPLHEIFVRGVKGI